MTRNLSIRSDRGFSMMELLVSIAVLIPVMGASISLFSIGARQHATTQGGIDVNQEARSAMEIMTTEIAQAGSHADVSTATTGAINNPVGPYSVRVASTAGFNAGDYVDVGVPPNDEIVCLSDVTATSLTGDFKLSRAMNAPIRLRALPYIQGIIPPAGTGASASVNVTTLRFFGHIQGANSIDRSQTNPTAQYIEYNYDADANQITRSATPITQREKDAAVPLISNLTPGSVRFTLNTDIRGIVTSVTVAITVRSRIPRSDQYQSTPLSSRITIPSAIAGSALLPEFQTYQPLYPLPTTPAIVKTWAGIS